MFPEQLYLPTAYDYAVGIAPRRFVDREIVTSTAGGANTPTTATIEANKVLLLQGFHVSVSSDAVSVETVRQMRVVLVLPGPGGTVIELHDQRSNIAAGFGQSAFASILINLFMMPEERIQASFTKSAAVDSFSLVLTVWGVILPRANIQSG